MVIPRNINFYADSIVEVLGRREQIDSVTQQIVIYGAQVISAQPYHRQNRIGVGNYYGMKMEQVDEVGQITLPGALHKSPFISSLDLDPYGARVRYEDYDGLLGLHVNLDTASRTVAIQQLDKQSIDLEFWNDLSEFSTYRITTSNGTIHAQEHLATKDHFFLALTAEGPLYLNEDPISGTDNGSGQILLVFSRADGELLLPLDLPGAAADVQLLSVGEEAFVLEKVEEGANLWRYADGVLEELNVFIPGSRVQLVSDGTTLEALSLLTNEDEREIWSIIRFSTDSRAYLESHSLEIVKEEQRDMVLQYLSGLPGRLLLSSAGQLNLDDQNWTVSQDSTYFLSFSDGVSLTAVNHHAHVRPVAFYPHLIDSHLVTAYRVAGTLETYAPSTISGEAIISNSPHEQVVLRNAILSLPSQQLQVPEQLTAKLVLPQGVRLQPNPAYNSTTITGLRANARYQVQLLQLDGAELAAKNATSSAAGTLALTTAELAPGLYIVRVYAQEKSTLHVLKLVKL